ncbi:monovalent cation/H(+) antiporter subunit G [Nocardioides marmotae]|uniref:Na+/H+ antiporter subunit G n=1 Tax=Nocardioides marmotae TaxID=2663857 RepID=A0A6I3J9W0_9ACTN|nr:monovalent cation/H(+) antiporter subunit G [Nocardioides marmotae]MCR6030911.1 Na+/H+ antiporter subunit G [Gordonia jinghuaiqii]MBC9731624.1 monovalent cation/H(+) antiporter subunit G [Nocardioides marmotae]MTB82746.1 Na+/H+ antiporter subunit G [Nocardioides marmotae]MTB94548.1 Na+/H+ antiporter subunit G [Nocardioides marmotae]QKE01437.1 monovalent cation/H(+) antiporter subunit G [Nocardioides marmotae]
MSWTLLADGAAAACFLVGAALTLVAAIGQVRMPDLLSRMHAATKPQVLGTVLVVAGLALRLREPSVLGLLLLVVLLQMATSVVASHMVGRASFRAGQVREDLLVVDDLRDTSAYEEPRGAP